MGNVFFCLRHLKRLLDHGNGSLPAPILFRLGDCFIAHSQRALRSQAAQRYSTKCWAIYGDSTYSACEMEKTMEKKKKYSRTHLVKMVNVSLYGIPYTWVYNGKKMLRIRYRMSVCNVMIVWKDVGRKWTILLPKKKYEAPHMYSDVDCGCGCGCGVESGPNMHSTYYKD